jgi:hypothetical protein
VQTTLNPQQTTGVVASSQTDMVTKLAKEFKELKLFVIQGQNARAKSPVSDRPPAQRSIQFVTCHGCGKRGHYKSDCPDIDRGRSNFASNTTSSSRTKQAEVNLLELSQTRTKEEEPQVMMAKRSTSTPDIDLPARESHKSKKYKHGEGPSKENRTKRIRRRIGNEDLLLSRGQGDYSIVTDLSKQSANISIGQLIARCPSLRRELRQGISTRRQIQPAEVRTVELAKGDMKSSQVEARIDNYKISGCLVDGGAVVNVLASWLLGELNLQPSKPTNLKLKVTD